MNMVMGKKRMLSAILLFALGIVVLFSAAIRAAGSTSDLSQSDVNAILESIRSTSNSGDIASKIDELINRANLTGNEDLKQYAEYAKQAYELQSQLNSINESIDALIAKNSSLSSINNEIKQASQIGASYDDMSGLFSTTSSDLLKSLDEASFAKIRESVSKVDGIKEKIENPALASEYDRALIDILMLNEAINQGFFEGDAVSQAKAAINSSVVVLAAHERSKYTDDEYNSLVSSSVEFGQSGNKTKAISPTNVVMLNEGFKLKNAAICYDETVLISIDDVLQFVNGKMQYTSGTSNMALVTADKLVEFTVGQSEAYVNDKSTSTNCPVLSFNGIAYLSVEFVAEAFDIEYITVSDLNAVILYSNLNQIG